MIEKLINKTLYNDLGVAIGKWNDYATAKFDIRMIGGSTMPVNRWAYLQELKELANSGIIDPQAVLAESDIRNKAKIAQRMDKVKQLEGQLGGLEEQIKDKDGTIETLERQLVQLGIKDKVRQAELEIDKKKHETKGRQEKQFLETEAMQKNLRNIMKVELDSKRKGMDSTLKDFKQKLGNNLQNNLQNNKKQ